MKCIQKQQQEANMGGDGTRNVTDYDQSRFVASFVFEAQVNGHTIMARIGPQRASEVELAMQSDATPLGVFGGQTLGHARDCDFHALNVWRTHPAHWSPDSDLGHEIFRGRFTEKFKALLDQCTGLALQQVTCGVQYFCFSLRFS
jgi:hypothetical protein